MATGLLQSGSGYTAVTDECCTLTDMPNEILVQIFSLLETRAILHIRSVCPRLRAVTGDPIHWSAISWRVGNRIGDAEGLKLALKLSEGVLKHLGMYQGFSMPQCMEQILACHSIQSISLQDVAFTAEQLTQIVHMPAITYLKVDQQSRKQFETVIKIIATTGSPLKTLALVWRSRQSSEMTPLIKRWSDYQYFPPNLCISLMSYCDSLHILKYYNINRNLALPPSTSHDAYLSYCGVSESYISIHPLLQFSFTPSVSLSTVCYADLSRQLEILYDAKLKFEDICHNLTGFILPKDTSPSQLGTLAGSCPNLKCLNLNYCKEVLSDLAGLTAVASGCPKLQELHLYCGQVECVDKLWKVMSLMSSLRELAIPVQYASIREQPSVMPRLTTIHVYGEIDMRDHHLLIKCLASIPSLRYFVFDYDTYFPGILNSAKYLTHLFLRRFNMTSLPMNPSFYSNLEQLCLRAGKDFNLDNNVADALCQSKKLRVLCLIVDSIEEKDIIRLASSLESLYKFHISTKKPLPEGFADNVSSLVRSVVARKGRAIDFVISRYFYIDYPTWAFY